MKIIGILLIIAVSSLFGIMKSGEYKERVRQLEQIISLVSRIKTEIRYKASPLSQILGGTCGVKEFEGIPFLNSWSEHLSNGGAVYQSLSLAMKENQSKLRISKIDCDLIYSFARSLGTSDIDGQIANCDLHLNLFKRALEEARTQNDTMGKLCITLGALCGLGLAIFFI